MSIPVPSLASQQRIASEIDCLNEMIALKQEQLKEFDKLAQSIFYDMFGDPVSNEKGWDIIELGTKCEVTSFKRVLIEEVVDSGIPFIRGTELMALSKATKGEQIDFSLFITPEHYERVKTISGVPKVGDLLIPSINSDGNIWILDTDEPRYYKDGRVLWVHVNHDAFSSEALKYIMHILLKKTYSLMATGATFAELKLFVLRELKVPLPPLELQQQFADKISAIEAQKELVKQSIAETQALLDYTMDYYFNE
jgi:type I restriction enzyme S subunit